LLLKIFFVDIILCDETDYDRKILLYFVEFLVHLLIGIYLVNYYSNFKVYDSSFPLKRIFSLCIILVLLCHMY